MKIIYFTLGTLSLMIGFIGVILPVLPTTPFLLVTAYCYAKSSKRFHCWFINTSLYQNHLATFMANKEMTKQTKIRLLSFASCMLLIAMYFMNSLHLRLFIVALIIFKYYYFIFCIKTIPEEN